MSVVRLQALRPLPLFLAALLAFGCNLSDPIEGVPSDDDGGMLVDMGQEDGGGGDTRPVDGGADSGGGDVSVDEDAGVDMEVDMGPPPLEFTEYCSQVASDYVRWLRGCYNNEYYDPEDPMIVSQLADGCLSAAPAIDAGTLVYDPEQARTCLTALEDETCDHLAYLRDVPECDGVVTGQQQLGDDCHASVGQHFALEPECAEGYCFNDACPGTCQDYAQLDESCGGFPYVQCDDAAGVTCDWQAETCAAKAAEDEDCTSIACANGLRCVNTMDGRRCTATIALGEGCDVNDDRCEDGTFCSDGTCTSKADTGASCRQDYQCPFGDSCLDQDGTGQDTAPGICRARGAGGAVCYRTSDCQTGFRCDADVCTALPVEDEACVSGACAPGLWCRHEIMGDTGVCMAEGQLGAPCEHGYGPADTFAGCEGDQLFCLGGTCLGPGDDGDPCLPNSTQTCQDGFFCNRTDQTCTPLAAEGEPCNPWWWPGSCAEGLGCGCGTNPNCGSYDISMNPGDVCAPALQLGDPCQTSTECATGSCWDPNGTGTNTCQPGSCFLEP